MEDKIDISKIDKSLLSDHEREFLEKLLKLKTSNKTKKTKSHNPVPFHYVKFKEKIEEYFLKNYMRCLLCEDKWEEWYFMEEVVEDERKLLSATLIQDPKVVKFKERRGFVHTCPSCRRKLRLLEKEELITKLIWTNAILQRRRKDDKKGDIKGTIKSTRQH